MKLFRIAFSMTPESLAQWVNTHCNVRNADGTPGKMSIELAAKVLEMPEFRNQLPPLPPDVIVAGRDDPCIALKPKYKPEELGLDEDGPPLN
jgi:hypothetical protein